MEGTIVGFVIVPSSEVGLADLVLPGKHKKAGAVPPAFLWGIQ